MTAAALLLALSLGPAAANPDDLLDAVRKGDLAAVKAALDAGVPVDHPFRYERTALSFAAARGQVEIVKLLLERGAHCRGTVDRLPDVHGWRHEPGLLEGAGRREQLLGRWLGRPVVHPAGPGVARGGHHPGLLAGQQRLELRLRELPG